MVDHAPLCLVTKIGELDSKPQNNYLEYAITDNYLTLTLNFFALLQSMSWNSKNESEG